MRVLDAAAVEIVSGGAKKRHKKIQHKKQEDHANVSAAAAAAMERYGGTNNDGKCRRLQRHRKQAEIERDGKKWKYIAMKTCHVVLFYFISSLGYFSLRLCVYEFTAADECRCVGKNVI